MPKMSGATAGLSGSDLERVTLGGRAASAWRSCRTSPSSWATATRRRKAVRVAYALRHPIGRLRTRR